MPDKLGHHNRNTKDILGIPTVQKLKSNGNILLLDSKQGIFSEEYIKSGGVVYVSFNEKIRLSNYMVSFRGTKTPIEFMFDPELMTNVAPKKLYIMVFDNTIKKFLIYTP